MAQLDELIKGRVDPLQLELIKIRASQINGCAYCMNKHITDALRLKEGLERINVLSGWKEAGNWFSEEEKTILAMTEEITLISQHGLSNAVYQKALELFGEERLAALIMAIVSINAWNRVGVALRMHPVKYNQ